MKFLASDLSMWLLAGLAAAGAVAALGVVWWRATADRRAMRRRVAEAQARRARADQWWRQHTLSTVPHSRFLESMLDAVSTRPPRIH